jgi:serine/threonine protein phosphatase PrpC/tetratricopeptide (TPR) repeat protein
MSLPVKKFNLFFSAKSDIGLVRTENQDNFGKFPENNLDIDSPKGQLFIVADGMGGHKGGKEASTIAVKVVKNEYFSSEFEESVALKGAIEKANSEIYNKSGDKTEFGRMGTTCSALVLLPDRVIAGHVGDSRIYKIENNTIEQITNDHTKVQEMLREGILTPEEARNYPSKSVLARALGVDETVRVDVIEDIRLKRGQSFVLCSDGLAKVSKSEILKIVSGNNPSDACDMMINLANERGGKDNVTVIVIKIDPEEDVKVVPVKPRKHKKMKAPRTRKQSNAKGWIGIAIVSVIIIILLYLQYGEPIFNPNNVQTVYKSTPKTGTQNQQYPDQTNNVKDEDSDLLGKADRLLREKNYDEAYTIYKKILDTQPMHQAALKGVGEIASVYTGIGKKLMNEQNFEEALKYFKKAAEVQPGDENIQNLIRLCTSQLEYKAPTTDSSGQTTPVAETKQSPVVNAQNFNATGWIYPGTNKNEFAINGSELSFTNTLSEKFVIYNQDLFDVTLSVNAEIDNSNSVIGLVIGYVSPLEYYIFKYRDGGDYTLLRIRGNDIEKLLVIHPKDPSTKRKMKIIYSDNLISIYDQNGLISSFKSVWGIFGKAGIYVDKSSSASFSDVSLKGKTSLD